LSWPVHQIQTGEVGARLGDDTHDPAGDRPSPGGIWDKAGDGVTSVAGSPLGAGSPSPVGANLLALDPPRNCKA
jgi:hypothetical protein